MWAFAQHLVRCLRKGSPVPCSFRCMRGLRKNWKLITVKLNKERDQKWLEEEEIGLAIIEQLLTHMVIVFMLFLQGVQFKNADNSRHAYYCFCTEACAEWNLQVVDNVYNLSEAIWNPIEKIGDGDSKSEKRKWEELKGYIDPEKEGYLNLVWVLSKKTKYSRNNTKGWSVICVNKYRKEKSEQ